MGDITKSVYHILEQTVGVDQDSDDLIETPKRFAKAWEYWTSGYNQDPASVFKTFDYVNYDELVLVKDIDFFSICEHHLAPIIGKAHVGYVPSSRIVGLSKLPRLVEIFARRLQVQERITVQIADAIDEYLEPVGVAVMLEARHLCIESRGVEKAGSITITSALRGCFKEEASARAEFFSMVR